tara:strand:- start:9723 stop:10100 length:378 start_codon:yes stop_codon:yes gene_type:complete
MNKDEKRKSTPVFSGLFTYFPRALAEVSRVSVAGNEQHLNGKELHWDRTKSSDHLNSGSRHLLDLASGEVYDEDSQRHLAKAVWRLLAQLEIDLEEEYSEEDKAMSEEDLEDYVNILERIDNKED